MNGRDIFMSLKYVGDDLIEQAECGEFCAKEAGRRKTVRPLLLAALIALMLLLVGCAVVYALSMQNFKMENGVQEEPIFAPSSGELEGYRSVDQQILTLTGLKGSASYQASQEWFRFRREYDPGLVMLEELNSAGTVPEFPAEYESYNLYTQELKDQLDGILAKYDLAPEGSFLAFRTLKNMCAALGIEKIQTARNDVTIRVRSGSCCSGGNFGLTLDFEFPTDGGDQLDTTWGKLNWYRKDCFSQDYISIADTDDWKEWNYTTTSGSEVLIIRSASDWRCWIVCDRGEAIMALQLNVQETYADYIHRRGPVLSDRQIEQAADAIDFTLRPNKVSQEDVLNQPPYIDAVTQNGFSVELKDVKTDGYVLELLLGVTAPEGQNITCVTEGNVRGKLYSVYPANYEYLIPAQGEKIGGNGDWEAQNDGDGLDHTASYLYTTTVNMADGSAPFGPGTVWNLHIEDLMQHHFGEKTMTSVEKVLVEGEWNYEITFGQDNGNYEMIELLSSPITMKAVTGFDTQGKEIYGDVEVTSIQLRSMSARVESGGGSACLGLLNAVMKDGSSVPLVGGWNDRVNIYRALETIDLYQVDYLLLEDGTQIPVPSDWNK